VRRVDKDRKLIREMCSIGLDRVCGEDESECLRIRKKMEK
jgi:hypothetical protein